MFQSHLDLIPEFFLNFRALSEKELRKLQEKVEAVHQPVFLISYSSKQGNGLIAPYLMFWID
jgi:hypothetical protein